MEFGIDRLIAERELRGPLAGKRLGLVAHPASVTEALVHSLDALASCEGIEVVAAFGPQHGMKGDKQDNMVESADYADPRHGIPVFSLYGATRYPTQEMMRGIDVVLYDLQPLGCRIYTYLTTLKYFLEVCGSLKIPLWVLDRPNPAGRLLDGLTLRAGEESFVGCDAIPMAYGMTAGEIAGWMVEKNGLDVELHVIPVTPYAPADPPGFGWPLLERAWINPSPNAASLNMARCFPGTVLIEGTTLSEGRGTTTPLEVVGAPGLDVPRLLRVMDSLAPDWMRGATIRQCSFEPVFHKHAGTLCEGVQIHTDTPRYEPDRFKPYRLIALLLKGLRQLAPDYDLWRTHAYEYEKDRLAIDVINGGQLLRTWVDDATATPADLEEQVHLDLARWKESAWRYLLYP